MRTEILCLALVVIFSSPSMTGQYVPLMDGPEAKDTPSPHPGLSRRIVPSSRYASFAPEARFLQRNPSPQSPIHPKSTPERQLTCKFSSEAVDTAWVRHYSSGLAASNDRAHDIAVDNAGNIYVTGQSSGEYLTIKYDSRGDAVWVRRYNGPANYEDQANSVAVDGRGYVYVTGTSDYKYQQIVSILSGDYTTIKYDPSGDSVWVRRYNGPANSIDVATSLTVDGSGNVHVTGMCLAGGGYTDQTTIKYNANGDSVWVKRYGNVQGSNSVAVDGSGNVYVTGTRYGSGTSEDYATTKYNANGDEVWTRRYNHPENSSDHATALAVDGSGNVYVSGYSHVASTKYDYVTIKYNSKGDSLWVKRYNGPANDEDKATSLAVDNNGNVYVTGTSDYNDRAPVIGDFATIKYNPNGDEVWVKRYNGPGNEFDMATSLAVDQGGNVYVTGKSGGEMVTIKYTSAGNEEWMTSYSYGSGTTSSPAGIRVDGSGHVYVTGTSSGNGQSVCTSIKYSQTPTSVREIDTAVPAAIALGQNYPNPFNSSTTVSYDLPKASAVSLTILNMLGQVIATLVNGHKEAGFHQLRWNGSNVPSGIYFYRLRAGGFLETKKMVLLR